MTRVRFSAGSYDCATLFALFLLFFFVISVNVAYDGAVLGYTARRIIILMLFGWGLLLPHQAFLHCDLVVVLESIVCNGWLEHIFIWIHNVYVYVYVVYYICFV